MKKILGILPLVFIAGFYLGSIPLYIQGGDTAELVNASYNLFVPHPPGYPLFLWMEYAWTHLLSFSSVFWRAGFLCTIFAISSLVILGFPLRKKQFYFYWLPFLFLGLSPEFAEAAILPDVFALHAFFVVLVGYFYLFHEGHPSKRAFWLAFLFVLGFANHHTMLFLFPVYLFCCLENFRQNRKALYFGTGAGILAVGFLYLSLIMCHPDHPFSWGNVSNLGSLLNHFLRVDYGTFKLAASNEEVGNGPWLFLLKSLSTQLIILLAVLFFALRKNRDIFKDRKFQVWCLVFIIVFSFPFMMNIKPEFMGREVLRRFHVMPLTVLVLGIVFILSRLNLRLKDIWLLPMFALILIFNWEELNDFPNLRHDSIVEDYSRNLYFEAFKSRPAILSATSDTSFSGMRYIQAFEGNVKQDKVAVVSLQLFFHPWFQDKVSSQLPEFKLPRAKEISDKRELSIAQDIVLPNLNNVSYVTTTGQYDDEFLKVTFRRLGRAISTGSGTEFDETPSSLFKINSSFQIGDTGPQHFMRGKLYYEYAHFYLAKAFEASFQNDLREVTKNWEEAVNIVPYALPAITNLCKLHPERAYCSPEQLEKLQIATKGYY